MRYTMISVSQDGLRNSWIGAEFQKQANDERRHTQMVADRIKQLGGTPNCNPPHLQSRIAALNDCEGDFAKRVAANLTAEEAVIAYSQDLIGFFAKNHELSCAMPQHMIRDEEAHTSDMQDILDAYFG